MDAADGRVAVFNKPLYGRGKAADDCKQKDPPQNSCGRIAVLGKARKPVVEPIMVVYMAD